MNVPRKILRILLMPISLLWGSITYLRNRLYDIGLLKSTIFSKPTIVSIGNLSMGGTGKSPHIEYLLQKLSSKYKVATLSRGYGRDTTGFVLAKPEFTADEIGDEPRQFIQKFPKVPVAVDTHRVRGVKKLMENVPDLQLVLLDDAFQHRSVKPHLNILLTDYSRMFYSDFVFPSGYLREFKFGYKRADIIIVSKSPEILSPLDRRLVIKRIAPEDYQKVYFSFLKYGSLKSFGAAGNITSNPIEEKNYSALLFTGIANPTPLYYHLKEKFKDLKILRFPDHHKFSEQDIIKVKENFDNIATQNKILITTEKDAMRLDHPEIHPSINKLPLYYIPVEVEFHGNDGEELIKQIENYVGEN